jgi:hypothetical protein
MAQRARRRLKRPGVERRVGVEGEMIRAVVVDERRIGVVVFLARHVGAQGGAGGIAADVPEGHDRLPLHDAVLAVDAFDERRFEFLPGILASQARHASAWRWRPVGSRAFDRLAVRRQVLQRHGRRLRHVGIRVFESFEQGGTLSRVPQAASAIATATRTSRLGSPSTSASAGAAARSRNRASRCAAEIRTSLVGTAQASSAHAVTSSRPAGKGLPDRGTGSASRLAESLELQVHHAGGTPELLPRNRCGSPWSSSFSGRARCDSANRLSTGGVAAGSWQPVQERASPGRT